jgi:hypothetical protein
MARLSHDPSSFILEQTRTCAGRSAPLRLVRPTPAIDWSPFAKLHLPSQRGAECRLALSQVQQGTEEDVSIGGATQRVQPAPIDWSRASRNRWILSIFRVPWSVIPRAGRFGHCLAARCALSLASPVLSCRGQQRALRVQPRSGELSGGAVQGGTLLLAHARRIQRRKLRAEGWIQHEADALGAEEARLA